MAQPFVSKLYFDGVGADKQLKFDPTGLTLPSFVVGKVYALDASGDVVLATATSALVLGVYTGVNDAGFPVFEQLYYQETAAFTARGTRWYLTAAGALTSTPNDALFGIAIDADTLMIVWNGLDTGGTTPGVNYTENTAGAINNSTALDFQSDVAGGKPFADLSGTTPNAAIAIDKQIDYGPLAGSVGPVPTGFSFVAATYRACEVVYYLEKANGATETGVIVITHDGTNAGVVVTKRDSAVAPLTAGASGVSFTADVNAGNCRLLYTEVNGDALYLSVKGRPIVRQQVITVAFSAASSDVGADVPSTHTWAVEITTSDGLATNQPVSVDVIDLLTGSADGSDYTMATPQTLSFPLGTASGATEMATLTVLGNNQDDDVDTGLTNVSGAILGAQITHQINLNAAGA